MKAWHFVRGNRRLGFGHGETVAAGYVYAVKGQIALCRWGLHASVKPLDALQYAPGPIVCRVEMGGEIIRGADKIVAQTREVLWMADATNALHEFACVVAEEALKAEKVTDERSWAAIAAKRKWLAGEITSGDLAAARAAASAAARDADAAWAAAGAVDAARAASRAADAARAAAWAASSAAARAAAWAAAWGKQNALLTRMLNKLGRSA